MLYIIQQFQTRYHLYGNEWNLKSTKHRPKQKIAEIKEDNSVTVQIKRKGRQTTSSQKGRVPNDSFVLESTFNNACLWNILFWPGFLVDLGTQKMNKWDNTIINIEMEKENTENK